MNTHHHLSLYRGSHNRFKGTENRILIRGKVEM